MANAAYRKEKSRALKREIEGKFEGVLAGMDEPMRSMLTSILKDYTSYCAWTEELKKDIETEGFVIDGKENPKLAVLHKMGSRKADYFAKISKVLKDTGKEEELSALESFLDS